MEQVLINVYSVEELSGRAKERAYYNWLEGHEYFWSSENEDTLKVFADIFPVTVTGWRYDECTGSVDFHMHCDDDIADLSGIRLLKYIWNNYGEHLLEGKYYPRYVPSRASRHSKVILERGCTLTGYCVDWDILDPIFNFIKNPSNRVTFEDLMNDCLQSWARACSDDFADSSSMERFIEESQANEWRYDEDGDLV